MLRSRTLIAAALVIYGLSIDHQRCHAIEKIRNLIAHHRGNGVRTANGVEKRPTLNTATRVTRQTTEDDDDDKDSSMQYLHYAARSDDDNQYRDHDYDSASDEELAVRNQRRAGVTGPVHTYIKTDKNANFKWGVRHFVGKRYRGGRRWP
ncbi:uncharacterized protein LOC109420790 [Aedes albopictus]|uniref:Secreted protein n=1 Tax=Aedes albopictus TaxID=7160 RepID=A0ABM1ZRP1_AEDAL